MKALINGRPLLASKEVSWSLRSGTRPVVQTFDMAPQDAVDLAKGLGPFTLETDRFKVEFLYVINAAPAENPNLRRVTVADRRIWWSYKLVRRYYNKRRNVGVKRIKDPITQPEALSVVPSVWYLRWTLKDTNSNQPASAKWFARDVVEDVFKAVIKPEADSFGVSPRLKGRDLGSFNPLDVEDVTILDNGDAAMERVLAYLPEADLYVDYDGDVVFYSKASGAERRIVEEAGEKIVGQGDVEFVDNSSLRPREVDVCFMYEPEVRFDFDENGIMTVTDDTRYVENVLPIPDFSLSIGGQTLCQGTWITFAQAYAAWGAPPGFTQALSASLVEKAMVPFMDLWAGIELMGTFAPNADWSARIAVVEQHWRRTYRIQRHWLDKILKLLPYRHATVNQATGHRAPAVCYSDFCYVTGQRALFNEKKTGVAAKDFSYAINVKGHPAGFSEAASKSLNSNSKTAPAIIQILDHDQGIIHIDYRIDPYRLFEAILPSMMTLSDKEEQVDGLGRPLVAGPTADATNRGRPVSFDAVSSASVSSIPKLTRAHKASIIMTAMPGAPNDESALYRVKVKPADIAALVPPGVSDSLRSNRGPVMEIFIGPGIETARIPWLDSEKSKIEAIFGIPKTGADQSEKVKSIVLNDQETGRAGGSLQAIARAAAARFWLSLVDRMEGEMATDMNGALRPGGWLSEVNHVLFPDGRAFTKLKLPEKLPQLNIFTFLDSSTRAMVLKLASPDVTA